MSLITVPRFLPKTQSKPETALLTRRLQPLWRMMLPSGYKIWWISACPLIKIKMAIWLWEEKPPISAIG